MRAFPRRPQTLFLLRAVLTSGINQDVLRRAAGWPNYPHYYQDLRTRDTICTPTRIARLLKLAKMLRNAGIDFKDDQIFLDEPLKPRLAKREIASADAEAAR